MVEQNRKRIQNLVLAALFMAIGMVLPFATMQIKELGNSLLPMHLPVLLCGLICGWRYGAVVGAVLPLFRSVCFGMPILYPDAVCMAAELAGYGLVVGILYACFAEKRLWQVYVSLLGAMLAGRILWGVTRAVLLGVGGELFTLQMFLAAAFLNAIPGIALQLILIPTVMLLIQKRKKGTN